MERSTPLGDIARLIQAQIVGDPTVIVTGVAAIHDADSGQITFVANPKYASALAATRAAAVIVSAAVPGLTAAQLVVRDPYYAFCLVVRHFHVEDYRPSGVSPRAQIGTGVRLGRDLSIYPNVTVDDAAVIGDRVTLYPGVFVGRDSTVGDDSILYANVVVRERVTIGRRVIINAGSVIGSDGFGFATHGGQHHKIPQIGTVEIEDDVELGANVTVDRAALGRTRIGRGTKVDNLVQIAHSVEIGEHCLIVAQVGIAGSAHIGNGVTIAAQAGVAGHIEIGDRTVLGGRAGVTKDTPSGQVVSGFPAMPHTQWLAAQATFAHLPEMRKRLKALERRMDQNPEQPKPNEGDRGR